MGYCPYCMAELTGPYCIRCGKRADEVQNGFNLPAGTTLCRQRYVVGRVLGQGGFGVTYLGRDTRLNRAVAIKEYVPTCCAYRDTKNQWIRAYPEQGQQEFFEKGKVDFLEEVHLAAEQSSGRQSIVEIYDYFEENNTAYLVMEYLNGDSMQDFVEAHGPYKPAYLFALMAPLMRDLAEIHKRNVLHRDIAPNNIMHIKSDRLKLIDFGSARRLHGDRTMSILVHDGYAPPEQFMKKDQEPYTDVYALAATMYYCLTGEVPINSIVRIQTDTSWKNKPFLSLLEKKVQVTERQNDSLPSLLEKKVQVTERQNDAIMHALCVRIDERTQDMQQFMDELYGKEVSPEEKKQPLNPISERLEELRQKYNDKETRSGRNYSKEGETLLQDNNHSESLSGRTEPAGGYGTLTPVRASDPVPQGGETEPTEPKIELVGDEPVNKDIPPSDPRTDLNSGKQLPRERIIPPYRPPRPLPEKEVPEYRPIVMPNQPLDKRLVAGIGAALLLLLILILIPAISMAVERKADQAGQTNSVEAESKLSVESLSWLPGYWYSFDEEESCAEYQIQSDGSWTKRRHSLNSDRKQTVSTGTVTVVSENEVIIDQIQWKYQKEKDCLEPSGQTEQTECMMHFDEQLTLEQRQRNSDQIVKLDYEVKTEPESDPEPETMLEQDSERGFISVIDTSWLPGYWYHFDEIRRKCTEYYVGGADGVYAKRVRSLDYDTDNPVQTGKIAIIDSDKIRIDQTKWKYDEKNDYLVRYYDDEQWDAQAMECIMHYDEKLSREQLQSEYDRVMEMYANKISVTVERSDGCFAYPAGFLGVQYSNMVSSGEVRFASVRPFEGISNYWILSNMYMKKDGHDVVAIFPLELDQTEAPAARLQKIVDQMDYNFVVEKESYSGDDWFRVLVNLDGYFYFFRGEYSEDMTKCLLLEYMFEAEDSDEYLAKIYYLERNFSYTG